MDNSKVAQSSILAGVKIIGHAVGVDDEAIDMGEKASVVLVSTLVCMQPLVKYGNATIEPLYGTESARGMLDKMYQGYRRIHKSGSTLAIGTDNGGAKLVQKLGNSAIEIEPLVKHYDLLPMDIIVAATRNGAIACFSGDKKGTIEPCKFADIIVVGGNPLADIKIFQDAEKKS